MYAISTGAPSPQPITDTFLEAAYSGSKWRRQTLVPFIKDDEPVDEKMRSALNPVQYLKLHGCLNHRYDKDVPLVLSWEQFASYSQEQDTSLRTPERFLPRMPDCLRRLQYGR